MTSNKSSSSVKKAAVLSVIAVLVLVSPRLFSQAAVGTILGGVFDSTGGAIAGAKVTITDVDRGTMRVLTADATGEYTAPSLLAGNYSVRAEANGFQTLVQANVVLNVAAEVRVDLTLMPGAQTQSVTVTEEAPAIDTSNATLGGVITNQSITTLPLVSRNFLQLEQLRPGSVDVPGTTTPGVSTATNGLPAGDDVLVIEGVTQFDVAGGLLIQGDNKGNGNSDLPLDSIAEFTIQQNSPAEYGWKAGSAINVGIRSGTNDIHGSAYAFGRDAEATDAKQYSPVGNGQKNNLAVEQPGFTLGGPIIKNKLFFFVSAEFIRSTSINTNGITVPSAVTFAGTPLAALGTTYSMVDACNAVGRANVSPLSAQIAGLPPGSCIPAPATSTFENLMDYNQGASQIAFPFNMTIEPSNNGLAKLDYKPNDHNSLSTFIYISQQTATNDGEVEPYWGAYGFGWTREFTATWTWTPNSSWVNDLRAGAAPNYGGAVQEDINRDAPLAYPTGYSINTGVTTPQWEGMPCLEISGFYGSTTLYGGGLGDCGNIGYRGPSYQVNISDKVEHLYHNHDIKFGWEEADVIFANATSTDGTGLATFTNLQTFLTGTVNSGALITGDPFQNYREHWHAAFVQDTWRVTRKITLTPGLRWQYTGSPHAVSNEIGTFNPNVPGGVQQCGPGLPCSRTFDAQKSDFGPRVGAAWDIRGNGRTVLRAGIGEFYDFTGILSDLGLSVPWGATLCTGSPCTAANTVINRAGLPINTEYSETLQYSANQLNPTWTTTCTNPLVTSTCSGPVIFPQAAGQCTTGTGQCSMTTPEPNYHDPRDLEYNVDLQRALTNNLTLDVAYVGTHGWDQTASVDLNEPALGAGWDASAISSCLATIASAANSWKSSCTVDTANITASRPYATAFPYYKDINRTESYGRSNYSGLQMTADARNIHGVNFLASYTFSHCLAFRSGVPEADVAGGSPIDPSYQYGNCAMDVRNRFRLSPTYPIPGIKSPGQMLEGWTISGIWALQNGFAWSPDDTTTDWGGTGATGDSGNAAPGTYDTWNFVGPHNAFNGNGINPIPCYGQLAGCTSFASASPAIQAVCLAAAQTPYATTQLKELAIQSLTSKNGGCYIENGGILTPPAYGTVGDASPGMFVGPAYRDLDVVVEKTWKFKERYSAVFRAECYNIFNQVNLAQISSTVSPATPGGAVGTSGFGYSSAGQGSMRQFQFGLKFLF